MPQEVRQGVEVVFNPKTNTVVDTFSIQISKRDPFLGTLLVKKKPIKRTSKKTIKKEVISIPLLYHGSVSKQDSKTKVFIVSINGQQHLMKLGQTINEVTLIKGNSKDIVVTYKGLKKTIQKT